MITQAPLRQTLAPDIEMTTQILGEESDQHVVIQGRQWDPLRRAVYIVFCIVTLGLGHLMARWWPKGYAWCVTRPCALANASHILVVNETFHQIILIKVEVIPYKNKLGLLDRLSPSSTATQLQVSHSIDIPSRTNTPISVNVSTDALLKEPQIEISDMSELEMECRLFSFHGHRYIFHSELKQFLVAKYVYQMAPLSEEEIQLHRLLFGLNQLPLQSKSMTTLLLDEVLHPFNLFQLFSILLWLLDDYYFYAGFIAVTSFLSIASQLREMQEQQRELAQFCCHDDGQLVRTFRDLEWRDISSVDLVPGDWIQLEQGMKVPCDAKLLTGECLVNESLLTGESIPISKRNETFDYANEDPLTEALDSASECVSVEQSETSSDSSNSSSFQLYAGTLIISTLNHQHASINETLCNVNDNSCPVGVVTAVGCQTRKGQLMKSVFYPRPNAFSFDRDAFRYLKVMSVIALILFLSFGSVLISQGMSWSQVMLRVCDLLTIVIPPALPATLALGVTCAVQRLKKASIYTNQLARVNVCGKVSCVVMDKTGTLTEENLSMVCVVTENGDQMMQSTPLNHVQNTLSFYHALATCHQLKLVNGVIQGDPLDKAMFEWSQWQFKETGNGILNELMVGVFKNSETNDQVAVVKCFDFCPLLKRQSVIVRSLQGNLLFYSKGAPEQMKYLIKSVPEDYDEKCHQLTRKGYRVLTLAGRSLPSTPWHRLQRQTRNYFENDLHFMGFLLFENELKKATVPTISVLKQQPLQIVMCTGDNVLTAIHVAHQSGMLGSGRVFIAKEKHFDSPSHCQFPCSAFVDWTCYDKEGKIDLPNQFAMTGNIYDYLIKNASDDQLNQLLIQCSIYARMSPLQKQDLVERLQKLDYIVLFCGDGANDNGALKSSNVGVSLSDEVSLAAPFTSHVTDISCILELLCQGRAALVTSFACFQFMALYSLIQCWTVSLLYLKGENLGDGQYLWIDVVLIIPLALQLGRFKASVQLPSHRPFANLMSRRVLVPLVGHMILQGACQWIVYTCWTSELFTFSCFQYICMAALIARKGRKCREIWNKLFILIVTVSTAVSLSLVFRLPWSAFSVGQWFLSFLDLSSQNESAMRLLLAILINLIISLVAEWILFPMSVSAIAWLRERGWLKKKARKLYKELIAQSLTCSPSDSLV